MTDNIDKIVQALRPHRYQFIKEIGYGSLGHVYHFRDEHKQDKAVKWISNRDKVYQQFEESVNKQLIGSRHPNIISVEKMLRIPQDKGDLYVIMEYCDAGNMDEHRWEFSAQELIYIMKGVLQGLLHMHDNRIVHRKFEPASILLKNENGARVPKLCDFGTNCILEKDCLLGMIVGEVRQYMTPNHQTGNGHHSGIDMWSFGAVLYEMITGETPFADQAMDKIDIAKNLKVLKRVFGHIFRPNPGRDFVKQLLGGIFANGLTKEEYNEIERARAIGRCKHYQRSAKPSAKQQNFHQKNLTRIQTKERDLRSNTGNICQQHSMQTSPNGKPSFESSSKNTTCDRKAGIYRGEDLSLLPPPSTGIRIKIHPNQIQGSIHVRPPMQQTKETQKRHDQPRQREEQVVLGHNRQVEHMRDHLKMDVAGLKQENQKLKKDLNQAHQTIHRLKGDVESLQRYRIDNENRQKVSPEVVYFQDDATLKAYQSENNRLRDELSLAMQRLNDAQIQMKELEVVKMKQVKLSEQVYELRTMLIGSIRYSEDIVREWMLERKQFEYYRREMVTHQYQKRVSDLLQQIVRLKQQHSRQIVELNQLRLEKERVTYDARQQAARAQQLSDNQGQIKNLKDRLAKQIEDNKQMRRHNHCLRAKLNQQEYLLKSAIDRNDGIKINDQLLKERVQAQMQQEERVVSLQQEIQRLIQQFNISQKKQETQTKDLRCQLTKQIKDNKEMRRQSQSLRGNSEQQQRLKALADRNTQLGKVHDQIIKQKEVAQEQYQKQVRRLSAEIQRLSKRQKEDQNIIQGLSERLQKSKGPHLGTDDQVLLRTIESLNSDLARRKLEYYKMEDHARKLQRQVDDLTRIYETPHYRQAKIFDI